MMIRSNRKKIRAAYISVLSIFITHYCLSQSTDLCHFSNYDRNIYESIYNNDFKEIEKGLNGKVKDMFKPDGQLGISPLKYTIILNRDSIFKSVFGSISRRAKRKKRFVDYYLKTAVSFGNDFAFNLLISVRPKVKLENYIDCLVDFLVGYSFSKSHPGEKSICLDSISYSSIYKLIDSFFEKVDSSGRSYLFNSMLNRCPEYLSGYRGRFQIKAIGSKPESINNLMEMLIESLEGKWDLKVKAYSAILLNMLKFCSDTQLVKNVHNDLEKYSVEFDNPELIKAMDNFQKLPE